MNLARARFAPQLAPPSEDAGLVSGAAASSTVVAIDTIRIAAGY